MEDSGSPKAEEVTVPMTCTVLLAMPCTVLLAMPGGAEAEEVAEEVAIPRTCTVILAMSGDTEPPLELSPMHSYTPS